MHVQHFFVGNNRIRQTSSKGTKAKMREMEVVAGSISPRRLTSPTAKGQCHKERRRKEKHEQMEAAYSQEHDLKLTEIVKKSCAVRTQWPSLINPGDHH